MKYQTNISNLTIKSSAERFTQQFWRKSKRLQKKDSVATIKHKHNLLCEVGVPRPTGLIVNYVCTMPWNAAYPTHIATVVGAGCIVGHCVEHGEGTIQESGHEV